MGRQNKYIRICIVETIIDDNEINAQQFVATPVLVVYNGDERGERDESTAACSHAGTSAYREYAYKI